LFYRKLLVSNNVLIRTLMCVTGVYYDYVSLCSIDILFWIHTVPGVRLVALCGGCLQTV